MLLLADLIAFYKMLRHCVAGAEQYLEVQLSAISV